MEASDLVSTVNPLDKSVHAEKQFAHIVKLVNGVGFMQDQTDIQALT